MSFIWLFFNNSDKLILNLDFYWTLRSLEASRNFCKLRQREKLFSSFYCSGTCTTFFEKELLTLCMYNYVRNISII